jgi:hypothetical protein
MFLPTHLPTLPIEAVQIMIISSALYAGAVCFIKTVESVIEIVRGDSPDNS